MATRDNNEQYWLAYSQLILDAFQLGNIELSERDAIYISSRVERAPCAGESIPSQFTNNDVAKLGDTLLEVDKAIYNADSNKSYILHLREYLENIELPGGSQDPGAIMRLENAETAKEQALEKWQKKLDDYMRRYNDDTNPNKGSFDAWATTNAPDLRQFQMAFEGAAIRYYQTVLAINGPGKAKLAKDKDTVDVAYRSNMEISGQTMLCSTATMTQLKQMAENQKLQGTHPDPNLTPSGVFAKPLYMMDEQYSATLDEWAKSNTITVESQIKLSDGSSTTSRSLAVNKYDNAEFGIPWIQWNGTARRGNDNNIYGSDEDARDITIGFKATNISTFEIGPGGEWNVDAPSVYPYPTPGFTDYDNVARPTQLLCASGLEMSVRFGKKTKQRFETDYRNMKNSSKGTLRIFGFHLGVGETTSTSGEEPDFYDAYDTKTGTLTIKSGVLTNTAALLGVVATKLKE